MSEALSRAYRGNPALNAQRAGTRAVDEGVAKAVSGYRPKINGAGYVGFDDEKVTGRRLNLVSPRTGQYAPRDGQVTVTEKLFDGNRTTNTVRRSESLDFASRETLRSTEQQTLLAGATAYMDVLRDLALVALARNEVMVLEYELRGSRARYRANEVTFTDVAEVATNLAQARTRFANAEAALQASMASFRRIIGTPPTRLEAAGPVDGLVPATQGAAIAVGLLAHPRIAAALHDVDAAETAVHVEEGKLLPTVDFVGRAEGSLQRNGASNSRAELEARLRAEVPIYDGGATYAEIRKAKEQVAVVRLRAEAMRDQVRAEVMSSWGQREAAKALIFAAKTSVTASEVALTDVRAEASMGQRTTYDILLAIQALFKARTMLITAQHDRVVASYGLAAATGRLGATSLGLSVTPYDPTIHYMQVRDKWAGMRTPDGR